MDIPFHERYLENVVGLAIFHGKIILTEFLATEYIKCLEQKVYTFYSALPKRFGLAKDLHSHVPTTVSWEWEKEGPETF